MATRLGGGWVALALGMPVQLRPPNQGASALCGACRQLGTHRGERDVPSESAPRKGRTKIVCGHSFTRSKLSRPLLRCSIPCKFSLPLARRARPPALALCREASFTPGLPQSSGGFHDLTRLAVFTNASTPHAPTPTTDKGPFNSHSTPPRRITGQQHTPIPRQLSRVGHKPSGASLYPRRSTAGARPRLQHEYHSLCGKCQADKRRSGAQGRAPLPLPRHPRTHSHPSSSLFPPPYPLPLVQGNLAWSTTAENLKAIMETAARVVAVEVQTHSDTGRSKGWA